MAGSENKTAPYRVISDAGGNRYRFFCEPSGMAIITTRPVCADKAEDELFLAWESEGHQHFNLCQRCGKWACDAMFNPDASACVLCAPWTETSAYCPHCGAGIPPADEFCRRCGARLRQERGVDGP